MHSLWRVPCSDLQRSKRFHDGGELRCRVQGLGFRAQGLGELDEHSFPAPPIPPSQYGLKNSF